jgi:acetyl-CoA carboxylase biotin carboxyl carrier protein
MTINFKELNELLAAIATNNITELTLKNADFELTVSQGHPQFTTITTVGTDVSQQLVSAPTPEVHPTAVNQTVTPAIDKNSICIQWRSNSARSNCLHY